MDGRPTWTDCDEVGDYVVPNVLSPRDLVSRPDIMDETVPHTYRPCVGHIHVQRNPSLFLFASVRTQNGLFLTPLILIFSLRLPSY